MPRLQSLQAARGVAANLVLLAHLYGAAIIWTGSSALPSFSIYGVAGVDLFFVLSGFIMVAVAGRNTGPLQFIWRRAARIYPPYWLASLLMLCILAAHATIHSVPLGTSPSFIWRSFLLIPQKNLPLLVVGWTLVFEMYFYVVFTAFLALRIPIAPGLVGWGLIVAGLNVVSSVQIGNSALLYVAANPMTAEFIMGAAIGVFWFNRRMPGSRIAGAVGVVILAVSVFYLAPAVSFTSNPHLEAWRVILFGIPAALILYGLVGMELRSALTRVPLIAVKLGDWSYGTYLMHSLVIGIIGKLISFLPFVHGVGKGLILVAAGLIAANLVGAAVHIFFERPTLRYLHNLGPRLNGKRRASEVRERHMPSSAERSAINS